MISYSSNMFEIECMETMDKDHTDRFFVPNGNLQLIHFLSFYFSETSPLIPRRANVSGFAPFIFSTLVRKSQQTRGIIIFYG